MIDFHEPQWFFLLGLFAFLGWYAKSLELWRPLRILCVVTAVLALTNPTIQTRKSGSEVIVLADRSASAQETVGTQLSEWEEILNRSKADGDMLVWIDFASDAIRRDSSDLATYGGGTDRTRLALAIQLALSTRASSHNTRILALTDGYATDSLNAVELQLLSSGIPLDYRLGYESGANDYRIQSFNTPAQIDAGETFLIEAVVAGSPDREVPYQLFKNGHPIHSGEVVLNNGLGTLRLFDRLTEVGGNRYRIEISAEGDPHPQNNQQEKWVTVSGKQRVLLITAWHDDPLASALAAQQIDVQIVTDYSQLSPGHLSGMAAVLLHNVPANELTESFMQAVQFYVREQGGGFAMIGGRYSFGSGGYHDTPIAEVLPVSAQLREENRKLATTMVIVMDRSGSMGATVAANLSKMDLANEGASQSVGMLGSIDTVSIIAVDSEPDVVIPLTQIGDNTEAIQSRVRRIVPTGGGIFVYNGLQAAYEQLQGSRTGQRHIILFSDANDTEQPDDYVRLIEKMRTENTTLSVIGLGTRADADAALLEDIAARGGGRMFFTENPNSLPALFAQETVAVARSAFIEDPVGLNPAVGWREIASRSIDWQPFVAGYNLTYLQEGATAAAFSIDDYEAPLIAFWQRGSGRSAAVAFPLAGEDAQTQLTWAGYQRFAASLVQWLMRDDLPEGLGLRVQQDKEEKILNLYYDETWEARFANRAPRIRVSGEGGSVREGNWERMRPGHYQARIRPQSGEVLLYGAVQIESLALPFGPFAVEDSLEWQRDANAQRALALLSAKTQGKQVQNLAAVWSHTPTLTPTTLRTWILFLLLLLVLAEAYHKRFII